MQKIVPDTEDPAQKAAKRILFAFIGTYKKLNLYSQFHNVYQNALSQFAKLVDEFIEGFGNLRLRIEREKVFYNDDMISEGTSDPTDLVFILHRDGILWIEFQEGLQAWELDTFIKILHENSVLGEDAEDDIVTALWEFNLPSIAYEAADLELGLDDDLNLADFPCRPPEEGDDVTDTSEENEPAPGDEAAIPVLPVDRDELFQLSRDERNQIRDMVAAEEKLDGSDHVVDVLLYIIEKHSLPEDVEELLHTLTRELRDALLMFRFSYLHAVLAKLRKHQESLKSLTHWSTPHFERFFLSLSDAAFLNVLVEISPKIENGDSGWLKDLKRFLLLLDTRAIKALGPMMTRIQSAKLQRVLLETITNMATRDFQPLETLILSSDKTLAGRLIFILRYLKDERSRQLLSELLQDDSQIMRIQALKSILAREEQILEQIFVLIADPDEGIRKLVLQHLGRERNEQAEGLLLDYLKAGQTGIKDDNLYIAICRVLGKCASDRSLPYLKKMLFKWPGLGILRYGQSRLRRGALVALKELNTDEAITLIERTDRGFWGNFLRSI